MTTNENRDDRLSESPAADSKIGQLTTMRYGRIEDMDRSVDLAFWQAGAQIACADDTS